MRRGAHAANQRAFTGWPEATGSRGFNSPRYSFVVCPSAKPKGTVPTVAPSAAKPQQVQSALPQSPQKQSAQNLPKLLDQVRDVLRTKHYSMRTEESYIERNQIVVRRGKGEKDRPVPLPQPVIPPLQKHLAKVKKLHDADLKKGFDAVDLPFALDRKYTGLSREFNWQYVFPYCQRTIRMIINSKLPRSGFVQHCFVRIAGQSMNSMTW